MKTVRSLLVPLLLASVVVTVATAQFGGIDFGKASKLIDTAKDAGKVVKGAVGIGPEEELKIGRATALEIIGKYGGLVRDEEVMRRVNLIGRSVARYSTRPQLNWQFAVLNSDSVNAFSAPGGLVFITRGLYDQATNDDVLAGILGHEVAHVDNRHGLKFAEKSEAVSGVKSFLVKRSNQARQADAVVNQAGAMLGINVLGLFKKIVESGYDKETEFTADKDGRAAALTTGYAPGGLRTALIHLQEQGESRATMFPTHPPLADRIKRLPEDPTPPAEVVIKAADGKN